MKKDLIEFALYQAVTLIDDDNDQYRGWLVPGLNKDYVILPFDTICVNYHFKASHIKDIIYMGNGVSLKTGKATNNILLTLRKKESGTEEHKETTFKSVETPSFTPAGKSVSTPPFTFVGRTK